MSPRLPRITSKDLVRVLKKRGFERVRSSGSHHIYRDENQVRVTVPVHAGKTIHPRIIKRIIREIEITIEEFIKLLSK